MASAPGNVVVAGPSAPNQHDTNDASSAVHITSVVVGTLPGAGLAGETVDDPFTDPVGATSSKPSPARTALLPMNFGSGNPAGSQEVNFTETARPEVPAGFGSQAAAAPNLVRNEPNGDDLNVLTYVAQHQASTAAPAGNSVSGQSSSQAVTATADSTVPTDPSTAAAGSAAGTSAPTSGSSNGGSSAPTSVRPLVAGRPQPLPIIATGSDAGSQPLVKVFDALTGKEEFEFLAYDASFRGGVRVAVGDLNRDGIPDIITAPGPGMAPEVRVFDGKTGARFSGALGGFLAYDASYRGGVFVAAGFTNGDARSVPHVPIQIAIPRGEALGIFPHEASGCRVVIARPCAVELRLVVPFVAGVFQAASDAWVRLIGDRAEGVVVDVVDHCS